MEFLYIIGGIVSIVLFFWLKNIVWNKPREEINRLERDIEKLQNLHKEEISQLRNRLQNSNSLKVQENEFNDIVVSFAWREISELCNKEYAFLSIPKTYSQSTLEKKEIIEPIKRRFREAINEQYKYRYLLYLYPELTKVFDGVSITPVTSELPATISTRSENLFEIVNLLKNGERYTDELIYLKNRISFLEASQSNLTAIPYMAEIMADYETYGLERLAKELDWGHSIKRMDKVKAIRDIRRDAQAIVEKNKESQYQLAYLLNLFPILKDIIDEEFGQLPVIEVTEISNYDYTRDYLSKEEYAQLSETDRNQLALDRYKKSCAKTKWQIGRDYELYVGHKYTQKGYFVDYFGSYMGLEDLGRDLIAKKGEYTLIVQCKYWSAKKQIHENHINQLYGTMASYCIEHEIDKMKVKGVLVTNIELSPMAKKMAAYLGIEYVEHYEIGDFPCIKCNIGHGEYGEETKIYHLPFDQQYDSAKINKKGEFYAVTVAEAEAAGFRRAFKWFGTN